MTLKPKYPFYSKIKNVRLGWLLISLFWFIGCHQTHTTTSTLTHHNTPVRVAFLADVHFHDVFASVPVDQLPTINDTTAVFLRTMHAQSSSTRLFNENYFALLAALNDIVTREIRYVVLNGDFSDDGQPVHINGLKRILEHYASEHDLRFFMAFGNHDPYLPYTTQAGKSNFLFEGGHIGGMYSQGHPRCQSGESQCFDDLRESGYQELFASLSDYGFLPRPTDIHFETPFTYHASQQLANNTAQSYDLTNRTYIICSDDALWCAPAFDTSYLISPEPGIWFLSIDANVHIPRSSITNPRATAPENYLGSGNAGFNAVVQHKPFLIDWIADVAQRAEEAGAQLFTFSHFPIGDFHANSGHIITQLLGSAGMQQIRLPDVHTQEIIATTQIPFHVGGHMHLNNTHQIPPSDPSARPVTGIQSPSLSAYVPAYTVISYTSNETVFVEKIVLEDVPGFNTFFDLYTLEKQMHPAMSWSQDLLSTHNYLAYTEAHLINLVRTRFIPEEWPHSIQEHADDPVILHLQNVDHSICPAEITLFTLISDIYRIRNGGEFALNAIPAVRMTCYNGLNEYLAAQSDTEPDLADHATVRVQLAWSVTLLNSFLNRLPDKSFYIHLPTGSITRSP